jgi:hypothetical protein
MRHIGRRDRPFGGAMGFEERRPQSRTASASVTSKSKMALPDMAIPM